MDLSNIQRRLLDNEVEVLNKYRSDVVSFIKGEWDGWVYAGRPATGTSALEWEAVWAKADAKYAPKFMRAMLEAIKKNVLAPKNPRTIPGGMGSAETARRGGRSV